MAVSSPNGSFDWFSFVVFVFDSLLYGYIDLVIGFRPESLIDSLFKQRFMSTQRHHSVDRVSLLATVWNSLSLFAHVGCTPIWWLIVYTYLVISYVPLVH